jgi:hypothetical protein
MSVRLPTSTTPLSVSQRTPLPTKCCVASSASVGSSMRRNLL